MYEQYWGFTRPPFQHPAEADGFFMGEPQEEALARLEFSIDNSYRLAMLCGASGTGKSLMMERAARQLRSAGHRVVAVNLMGLEAEEFIFQTADALRVNYRDRENYATTWRGILDEFSVNRCQNLKTVLFFDDADEAEMEVLKNVVRITQWKPGEDTRVSVVLSTDAQRTRLLGPRLAELSNLRIDLYTWELADVAGFIQQSLRQVGRSEPIFNDAAYEQILHLTEGIARRVRRLADLSLIAAAGQQLNAIDAETVEMVHVEFDVMYSDAS